MNTLGQGNHKTNFINFLKTTFTCALMIACSTTFQDCSGDNSITTMKKVESGKDTTTGTIDGFSTAHKDNLNETLITPFHEKTQKKPKPQVHISKNAILINGGHIVIDGDKYYKSEGNIGLGDLKRITCPTDPACKIVNKPAYQDLVPQ